VSILKSVVSGGTGTAANPGKWPVFGKTGTAQDYRDAWFVGATRQLAAAVWMGAPDAEISMHGVGGVGNVTGGSFPARIWGQFMRTAMQGRPAMPFPAPDPRQIGNKQIKGQGSTPGTAVNGPAGPTSPGTTIVGAGGTIVFPDGPGGPPTTGGDRPPSTSPPPSSPPPTRPPSGGGNCDPPGWDRDQMGPYPCPP
jgi:membrane peptidoglycan carboxypeptidase